MPIALALIDFFFYLFLVLWCGLCVTQSLKATNTRSPHHTPQNGRRHPCLRGGRRIRFNQQISDAGLD